MKPKIPVYTPPELTLLQKLRLLLLKISMSLLSLLSFSLFIASWFNHPTVRRAPKPDPHLKPLLANKRKEKEKEEEKKKKNKAQHHTAFFFPQRLLIGFGASLLCAFFMACGSYLISHFILKRVGLLQLKIETLMVQ